MRPTQLGIALTLLMSATAAAPPSADVGACDPSLIKNGKVVGPTGASREIRAEAQPGTYVGSFRSQYSVPRGLATAVSSGEIRITVERRGAASGTAVISTSASTPYGGGGGAATSQLEGTAAQGSLIHGSSGYTKLRVDRVCGDRISGAVVPGPAWAGMQSMGATPISGSWTVSRVDAQHSEDPAEQRAIQQMRERAEQRALQLLSEARAVTDPLAPGVFPTTAQMRAYREAIERKETPAPLNDLFSRLGREGKSIASVDDCLGDEIIAAMTELARRRLEARLKEVARLQRAQYTPDVLQNVYFDVARAEMLGVEPEGCVQAGYDAADEIAQRRFEDGIGRAKSYEEAVQLLKETELDSTSDEWEANWELFERHVRPKIVAAAEGRADGLAFIAVQAQETYRDVSAAQADRMEQAARDNVAAAREHLARMQAEAAKPPSSTDPQAAAAEAAARADAVRRAEESLRDAEAQAPRTREDAAELRRMFSW